MMVDVGFRLKDSQSEYNINYELIDMIYFTSYHLNMTRIDLVLLILTGVKYNTYENSTQI